MILLAIIAMMYVNRDVKIPATSLFALSMIFMILLTVAGTFDVWTDVSVLSPEEAARVVMLRRIGSAFGYALRPCVILVQILIVLQNWKYRFLSVIPAVVNGIVYIAALFGSRIACFIDDNNSWNPGGPLRMTIFYVLGIYLLILLIISVRAFSSGDRKKSLILLVIFVQAVLAGLHEYMIGTEGYSNIIMALCILEYYIYLTIIYRQELTDKLDANIDKAEEAGEKLKNLSVEVMAALASAIDAKDPYTHGHSSRVAEYSRKLAEMNGKSEDECDEVYYAALLHDVGKIGVRDSIITKDGKLSPDEYEEIKKHPFYGAQILRQISEYPYLSIGACGHHERYDGKGYPFGLKGTDIPEIARIISVADAYDAMSSKRSYREAIPQQIVREEIVKGSGTQFDPEYARLMLHLIDVDTEYEMSEREEVRELAGKDELVIGEYRSKISEGMLITRSVTGVYMTISENEKGHGKKPVPSLVLFDSLDGRVHDTEREIRDLNYCEFGELWFDGKSKQSEARKIQTTVYHHGSGEVKKNNEYKIEAVKVKDHVLIRILGYKQMIEHIIALPDSSRYFYIGLTGEYCKYGNVSTEKTKKEVDENFIPRIAEEVSYIDGPAGDIPNVQIDGYRTDASKGIEVRDGLKIRFHAKCLPTARLVWHCPFVDVFCSTDGTVNGSNYRDLAFMRFDGEAWECDPNISLEHNVTTEDHFKGWDDWKKYNHDGFDTTVTYKVDENRITVTTENAGICAVCTIIMTDIDKPVYTAVTGDQVAITDIHIE